MNALQWLAAALIALFVAVSLMMLVVGRRTPGGRSRVKLAWQVFDLVFGLSALSLLLAQVDGAFWLVACIFLVRVAADRRQVGKAEPAPK
ncbi:hypothetical protein SFC79_05760 [Nocardioides sp. S-58]|uniref:DUF2516 family protein n=1 Tax=Nocardioides renjunii TaxID=3095075 RepID=A0ABU5K8H4_9ACTN|nr:hypothetical protein [Nocardioides sp. S-58]MDZ5661266.1 hypothetical protein [Nocardioides sp. S-58]